MSASARVIAYAEAMLIARDGAGRELTLRRMDALDRLRLFKAIGPVLAQNAPYLGMAMLASSVTAIDGVPVPAPASEGQLEALISRLGDHGIAAVADALDDAAPRDNQDILASQDTVHSAGNSAGTPI